MKELIKLPYYILLFIYGFVVQAQNNPLDFQSREEHTHFFENNAEHPCITNEQYEWIEKRCIQNIKIYHLDEDFKNKISTPVSLAWPLKAAAGLTDCSFYQVSAYVDQNTSTGAFQDYFCGSNTYDGHRGTDISTWPYNFYKMDHDLVQVISAAPGIILDKHDGEFDKNCNGNNLTANYIIIKHADGSQANYWHLKKNSLTQKAIGQSVEAGEFLGIVGSSGSSSGPHLHFEVWAGSTNSTRIDPFSGSCNKLNATSWWASQKSYKESSVVKVSVNTTDIVLPPCPATETLNESDTYKIPFQGQGLPLGFAKFYTFIRHEIVGLIADMSIINPDGSTFDSWKYTSASESKVRISAATKRLPANPGKYVFKATYNGTSCSTIFNITSATSAFDVPTTSDVIIYPNPSKGTLIVKSNTDFRGQIKISDVLGRTIFIKEITQPLSEIYLLEKKGIYLYHILDKNQSMASGKILIE